MIRLTCMCIISSLHRFTSSIPLSFWSASPKPLCWSMVKPSPTVGHADAKHLSGRTKSGKNILQLRQYGNQYRQNHGKPAPARHSDMAINTAAGHDLSAREIEVLVLITKGLINKGDCRQTEHQPDHRHLTPQEYHREAGYQVRVRADYLCRDARICGSGQNIILQPDTSEAKSFQKNFAPISVLMC